MTETVANYKVKTNAERTDKVWRRCPKCLTVYGYEIQGGAYLRVGNLRIQSTRSECNDCGYTIWWYSSDRHMRKITGE